MEKVNKIIGSIKQDKIEPTPKWYFLWKNRLFWLGFILFIILGAVAFSVIMLALQQSDFIIVDHFKPF